MLRVAFSPAQVIAQQMLTVTHAIRARKDAMGRFGWVEGGDPTATPTDGVGAKDRCFRVDGRASGIREKKLKRMPRKLTGA